MTDFVHLRLHSEFSLEDGTITLKQLIKHCQEQAFPAVAVTDMSNFFGLVRFYSSAVSAGVKPIMGMDVWLESAQTKQNSHKLCLLVQNAQGYKNLVELISKAYREHYLEGKPTIKREWLAAQHEGLIALTCAEEGELGQLVLEGKLPQALDEARWLKNCFADRLYIELVRTGQPHQEELVHGSAAIAYQANLPIAATNNARFIRREDFEAHEVRVCIHQGYVLYDERRPKRYTPEQYVKSADEMSSLFADYPEAIANTAIIAQRCNFQLHTGENFLPDFPVPEGMTTAEHLVHVSREGLENRFKTILAPIDESEREETRRLYHERLDFELRIINEMGFPGYFLIVADFIQWAKDHDIPVGPGRGSGAGSLVAYALEITNLDPIEYELLFERFLNPERVSMPDFDIDFCMDRREEVIDYVKDLYGKDAVSQIVTYGTLAARAVIKDVTRVQGKPYGLGDRMSKLIPGTPGMTLAKAYEQEPALREFLDRDDDAEMAQEIWTMAKKLEGLSRNTGKHAAGIVIAPGKLTDFSPLYCDENGDNLVTHYDKDDVEKIGLVKFDFLGLKTLTLIDWAVQFINQKREKTGQAPLDIDEIDLEDRATYELLSSGQTTAIFQLESSGMKQLIKRLRPSLFEDIIALVALYRPGPLGSGMVDDFVDRKHGIQKVEYPHPSLEPILKETYGTLVYQEQIMQTAQVLSSYTLGEADMLRRAMGKKKADIMAQNKQVFCERAEENSVDPAVASKIFEDIEAFAAYCFNKSHSAAYALVSYQTAWLKTHYPAQFMAATMSSEMENTDKIVLFLEECQDISVAVRLANVNYSEYKFTVDEQDQVIFGLGAVKGVGEGPIEAIIAARQDKPFADFFDFCLRVEKLNKRVLEALIKSGAMDDFIAGPEERATLMHNIPIALQAAQQQRNQEAQQMSDLFGDMQDHSQYLHLEAAPPWPNKLRFAYERDTLGLYMSGHPFDDIREALSAFTQPLNALSVQEKQKKVQVSVAGILLSKRVISTDKARFAVFLLDDGRAKQEINVGEELLAEQFERFAVGDVVIANTLMSYNSYRDELRLQVNQLFDEDEAQAAYLRKIELLCSDRTQLEPLRDLLTKAKAQEELGHCHVMATLQVQNEVLGRVYFTRNHPIEVQSADLKRLLAQLPLQQVKLHYQ